jgi:hypothetical protein
MFKTASGEMVAISISKGGRMRFFILLSVALFAAGVLLASLALYLPTNKAKHQIQPIQVPGPTTTEP